MGESKNLRSRSRCQILRFKTCFHFLERQSMCQITLDARPSERSLRSCGLKLLKDVNFQQEGAVLRGSACKLDDRSVPRRRVGGNQCHASRLSDRPHGGRALVVCLCETHMSMNIEIYISSCCRGGIESETKDLVLRRSDTGRRQESLLPNCRAHATSSNSGSPGFFCGGATVSS